MEYRKEILKSKYYIEKIIKFEYKKHTYTMDILYNAHKNVTMIIVHKYGNIVPINTPIAKYTFMYHTKCLNVQQHINNFIIELKEQGI